jgi:hypothetical protein
MTHPLSEAGTSVEVKPCPFCGDPMRNDYGTIKHVSQGACPIGAYAWGSHEAIEAWNRRALIQPTPAETEGGDADAIQALNRQVNQYAWERDKAREERDAAEARSEAFWKAQVSTLSRHLEEADDRLLLVYDWAWTDETGEQRYARTPERAERLKAQGHKLTPVYTIESRRELGVEPIRRAKETVSHG